MTENERIASAAKIPLYVAERNVGSVLLENDLGISVTRVRPHRDVSPCAYKDPDVDPR